MKLYELKRGDMFRLKESSRATDSDFVYKFSHVDGMYAPVHDMVENKRYYFLAWTKVERVNITTKLKEKTQ